MRYQSEEVMTTSSLAPSTNKVNCLNGSYDNPHSLVPTTDQAGGRNRGEDHPPSLVTTTNLDRMRLLKSIEGKPERKHDTPFEIITTFRGRNDVHMVWPHGLNQPSNKVSNHSRSWRQLTFLLCILSIT